MEVSFYLVGSWLHFVEDYYKDFNAKLYMSLNTDFKAAEVDFEKYYLEH